MSEYPKQLPVAYMCNACGELYDDYLKARDCCQPLFFVGWWECGVDGCQNKVHLRRIGAGSRPVTTAR